MSFKVETSPIMNLNMEAQPKGTGNVENPKEGGGKGGGERCAKQPSGHDNTKLEEAITALIKMNADLEDKFYRVANFSVQLCALLPRAFTVCRRTRKSSKMRSCSLYGFLAASTGESVYSAERQLVRGLWFCSLVGPPIRPP